MQLPTLDHTDNESLARLLETMSCKAGEIQEEVLQEILRKNANTEYLRGFLDGYTDKEVFKNNVPLVEYEDIMPYIERISNGESRDMLSVEPITELFLSSGTSGKNHKLIPTTAEAPNRTAFFFKLADNILKQDIESLHQGKRMYFRFVSPSITTPGGLVVRNASSSYLQRSITQKFSSNPSTSPDEVLLCEDVKQSMYSQLLCGLVLRDSVVRVGTNFGSSFLRVIKFLEEHWQELCSNIRTGHISNWISDSQCRHAVSSILCKPMPDLADLIENECETESWEGIIKKLWPATKCIEVIITGSMAQYIPKLEFYSGGVPLVSLYYLTTEGVFGLNLKPLTDPCDVTYSLIPWMAYYEFLPLGNNSEEHRRDDNDDPKGSSSEPNCMFKKEDHPNGGAVDLANVKLGQHYELVVTTFSGLYRYRVGDILMVADFHNNAPQFKFVQRRNVILSIDMDKTTEGDLSNAVSKAMHILEPLGFLLTDYTSYADLSSFPGHYVLFWELQKRGNDGGPILDTVKMEQCCNLVEISLDMMYKKLRKRENVIGPLEIRVVNQGTFDALMDFFLSQGSSLPQYKTPKSIKPEKAIQLLNSMVVGRFSSKLLPTH